jgi:hypothetical protein
LKRQEKYGYVNNIFEYYTSLATISVDLLAKSFLMFSNQYACRLKAKNNRGPRVAPWGTRGDTFISAG